MRSRLLRPSWLALHVLVVLALYVMVELGGWQWGRGEATGAMRNYAYGLEWWAFAVLTVVGWVKFCHDETAPGPAQVQQVPAPAVAPLPVAQPVPADEDPELAAWNARFAELARRDASS